MIQKQEKVRRRIHYEITLADNDIYAIMNTMRSEQL